MSNIQLITKNGSPEIRATADVLSKAEKLLLEENHVMHNKTMTLSFFCNSFSDNNIIRMGHGENIWGGSYAEITSNHVRIYEYTSEPRLLFEEEHGLTITNRVNVTVNVSFSLVKINVQTENGEYQSPEISGWTGRNGFVFAESTECEIKDVEASWSCSDYSKDIWLFGDSYFNTASGARWPYYLLREGHKNYLMSGFPGRDSVSAIQDFKQCLKHGTPKVAVWCLGMNNADVTDSPNPQWLRSTEEFLTLCANNKITPILSTVPCVPDRDNSKKNAWVKKSDYRYVDFASAVDGEFVGSSWYEGMLSEDRVHPDAPGAKALYEQFIKDFPEILNT